MPLFALLPGLLRRYTQGDGLSHPVMEGIDRKVAADQRGHGIGVAIDTYTTTDVESRREAVTRLEVALKDEEGTRNSKGSPRQGFRGKQGKGEFGGRS